MKLWPIVAVAAMYCIGSARAAEDACAPYPSTPLNAHIDSMTFHTGCPPVIADADFAGGLSFFATHRVEGAAPFPCVNTVDTIPDLYSHKTNIQYVVGGSVRSDFTYKALAVDDDAIWATDGTSEFNLLSSPGHTAPSARARAVLRRAMKPTGAGWRGDYDGVSRFDADGKRLAFVRVLRCPRVVSSNMWNNRHANHVISDPAGNVWFSLPNGTRVWLYRPNGVLQYLDTADGTVPIAATDKMVVLETPLSDGFVMQFVEPWV